MKRYAIAIAIILIFLTYLQIVASQELKYIALAIIVLLVSVAITAVFFVVWWLSEKMRLIKADRIEREKSAHVMVVPGYNETWIRDTNRKAEWHNLTGTPLLSINGIERLPTDLELKLHELRLRLENAPRTIENNQQLPAEIEDRPETLFDLLGSYPHIMFIAGSGSGKTTMINHCIEWYLKQDSNSEIVWMSTHINLDKDENNIHPRAICIQKPEMIATALNRLLTEYHKRRDNAGKYSKLIVALDEWLETVAETKDWIRAGDILSKISSGARKTNISLILAGQSGGVVDLDIKGRSAIKYNFAEVQLSIKMTEQNKAIWLNNRERIEIDIPGPFYSTGNGRIIELSIEKSKEQEWLELIDNGVSKNQACLEVFGRGFSGRLAQKLNNYASSVLPY
jgi:hypothetical protein